MPVKSRIDNQGAWKISIITVILLLLTAFINWAFVPLLGSNFGERRFVSTTNESSPIQKEASVNIIQTAGDPSNLLSIGSEIRFENLSVEQGLSQNTVYTVLQDRKGYMWFGTWDGLNKYDGYNFSIYRHNPDDPHSLSNNSVWSLYEDSSGTLWIGTEGGLNKFDPVSEQFTRYKNDPDDPQSLSHDTVGRIFEDSTGTLWVATWGGGLNKFDPENERFTTYRNDPANPFSLSNDVVAAICEDTTGTLWIGTWGGLDVYDRTRDHFIHYQYDPNDPNSLSYPLVRSIFQDHFGVLWIGTAGGGLDRYDQENGRFINYRFNPNDHDSLSADVVWEVFEDHTGTLWIATEGGLNRYDRQNDSFIRYLNDPNNVDSLSDDQIYSIFEDRSGVIWIGTANAGIDKIDPSKTRFAHYRNDPDDPYSLSHNIVTSIFEDKSGALWVGTYGGLNKYDKVRNRFDHYLANPYIETSLSSNRIETLLQDKYGMLWVGTSDTGLNRLNPGTEIFTRYRREAGNPRSLSSDAILTVFEDREGTLWIGTYGGGINRFDQRTEEFTHFFPNPDDTRSYSNIITGIHEDGTGSFWIGTGDGLFIFDRKGGKFVTRYEHDPNDTGSLSNNVINAIFEDRNGALWIGTDFGMNKFDRASGTFSHYKIQDGLPHDMVTTILEDNQGYLWIGTNKGISKFDPQIESFKNYDVSDGLQGNAFNGSAWHSKSGEMYFGGNNGFNAFYPDRIKNNTYVPSIVLTSIQQGGETVKSETTVDNLKSVTFQWPNNFFEFEFAALSFIQPEKNRYAYMLEGFDESWNQIGTRRNGRYTNLPPGNYTLLLKASNNDGVWNEAGSAIDIHIIPPFWQTLWFQGLVILLVLAGVVGAYRIRIRNVETRNLELKALVDIRTHALEQKTIELGERTHQLEERTREIERRKQELEALYQAEEKMHRHLHLDQVLQSLVDVAVDILGADKSSVLIWNEKQERMEMCVARGFRPEVMRMLTFPRGEGIIGFVSTTGETAIVEDTLTDPRRRNENEELVQAVLSESIRSFMMLPIKIDERVFAVFNVDFTEPHAFGEEELRLFTALAQRAALAIENAQLYEQTRELAVIEERNRLARELHDSAKQKAFAALARLGAAEGLLQTNTPEAEDHLKKAEELVYEVLQELATVIKELHPQVLKEQGLVPALRDLAYDWRNQSGVDISILVNGEKALPIDIQQSLFRISQEALANIARHSQARRAEIHINYDPETVRLIISDDGCGFDTQQYSHGIGLKTMRERAEMSGGTFDIESQPGDGTRLKVNIPLQKSN